MNDIYQIISELIGQTANIGDLLGIGAVTGLFLISIPNFFRKYPKATKKIDLTETDKTKAPAADKIVIKKVSWKDKLFSGLEKSRSQVWGKVGALLSGTPNDEVYEEIEEILFSADLSPQIASSLIIELKKQGNLEPEEFKSFVFNFLNDKMVTTQNSLNKDLFLFEKKFNEPQVYMIVGVNGAGKTTTIGKLATKLTAQGAKVVVGACDTFRAAAVEQLEVWCQRAGAEIVKAGPGADPTGVAYDAVKRAVEIGADYCLIDTAGRLHTKSNLMDELAKTKKVMSKIKASAPDQTLLVIDAITGQNALRQAEEFNNTLKVDALIFTKCDGSSKAGSAVGIVDKLGTPIAYIGVGEQVEDLDRFKLDEYLNALVGRV